MIFRNRSKTGSLFLCVLACAMLLSACASPTPTPTHVDYSSYTNSEKVFKIDIPTDWEIKEDDTESIQYRSRVHLRPQGYEGTDFPYLISIDYSTFNFDQNLEIIDLTNTILIDTDIDYGDFRAKKLRIENDTTGAIYNMYMLEYLSKTTILLILRSNETQYTNILDHMWGSFDSLR